MCHLQKYVFKKKKKKKDIDINVFNMITKKNEAKIMTKHIL